MVNAERAGGGVSYTDNQSGADAAMWATAIDYSPDLYELFFFRTN